MYEVDFIDHNFSKFKSVSVDFVRFVDYHWDLDGDFWRFDGDRWRFKGH